RIILPIFAIFFWGSFRTSGGIIRGVGKGVFEDFTLLMVFVLVCMGVNFIINAVLQKIKTKH
ncbi:stress protection protein MarC, partial [Enterobacter intestinihominis]